MRRLSSIQNFLIVEPVSFFRKLKIFMFLFLFIQSNVWYRLSKFPLFMLWQWHMLACTPNAISIILLFQLDYPPPSPLNPCTSFFHLPENSARQWQCKNLGSGDKKKKREKKKNKQNHQQKKIKSTPQGKTECICMQVYPLLLHQINSATTDAESIICPWVFLFFGFFYVKIKTYQT